MQTSPVAFSSLNRGYSGHGASPVNNNSSGNNLARTSMSAANNGATALSPLPGGAGTNSASHLSPSAVPRARPPPPKYAVRVDAATGEEVKIIGAPPSVRPLGGSDMPAPSKLASYAPEPVYEYGHVKRGRGVDSRISTKQVPGVDTSTPLSPQHASPVVVVEGLISSPYATKSTRGGIMATNTTSPMGGMFATGHGTPSPDSSGAHPKYVGSMFNQIPNSAGMRTESVPKLPAIPIPRVAPAKEQFAGSRMLVNRTTSGQILGSPVRRYADVAHVPQLSFTDRASAAALSDEPVSATNPFKAVNDTWCECWDEEVGAIYYYNNKSGEATWVPPDELKAYLDRKKYVATINNKKS